MTLLAYYSWCLAFPICALAASSFDATLGESQFSLAACSTTKGDEISFFQHPISHRSFSLRSSKSAPAHADDAESSLKHAWRELANWTAYDIMMISCVIGMLVLFDIILAPHIEYSMRNHALVLVFMMLVAGMFGSFVWTHHGKIEGEAWLTGYLMEWAMSVDNLFGLQLVFTSLAIPSGHAVRVVTIGTYFAMCFRLSFFLSLAELFQLTHSTNLIVGILLVISGLWSFAQNDDDDEETNRGTMQFFQWLFGSRLSHQYPEDGQLFTSGESGKLQITMLFLSVCVIAAVDCIFSLDNATSETGEIKSVFINVSSCILAMYALRSLFFIIKDVADYFEYAKFGVSGILIFVGSQMIFSKWFHIPLKIVLAIIGSLFSVSVIASVIKRVALGAKKTKHGEEKPLETSGNYPKHAQR